MKMKGKLAALFMGTALVLAACGGGEDETSSEGATTDTVSAGEKIYTQKCSSCHGNNLQGGVGPDLTTVGSKLSQEDIEAVINEGRGAMPPRLIEGEDVTAVAEWLASKK